MNAQSYLKPGAVERIFGRLLTFFVRIGLVRGHFYVLEVRGRRVPRHSPCRRTRSSSTGGYGDDQIEAGKDKEPLAAIADRTPEALEPRPVSPRPR